jgi:histone deacetylase 8
MYIDVDLHFSDGVSEAFTSSSKTPSVLTFSLHYAAPGFFPTSPLAALTRADTSTPFTLSIPLNEGTSCATLCRVWNSCVEPARAAFDPDFVVFQCGLDGLAGDPCGIWNLALDVLQEGSLGWVVQRCLSWDRKTLLLGGGTQSSLSTTCPSANSHTLRRLQLS